jgi:hypothetical protein
VPEAITLWSVNGTAVGGCSLMIHVRHAAAAISSGLCETVLITHGESGRSGVGRTRNVVAPTSLAGQFEQPYGPMGRRLCSRSRYGATRRPMVSSTSVASWILRNFVSPSAKKVHQLKRKSKFSK